MPFPKPLLCPLITLASLSGAAACSVSAVPAAEPARASRQAEPVFPGAAWDTRTPGEMGLTAARLDEVKSFAGGRGCIVRGGYLVYAWGDVAARGDVASAAKPWYAHFLFKAVEEQRLSDVEARAIAFEPRLASLNPALGFKDRGITFRHFATQTSGYGVTEAPGAAFDYNDFQMALFWDLLFLRVYGATYQTVDEAVLRRRLTGPLQCEDAPSFMAFGATERPGRLAISPRDFARFGLLYLREGQWNGTPLLTRAHARLAVSEPMPAGVPRTRAVAAAMLPDQRTIGSTIVPDDQTDHYGSYSWLWWVNGVTRDGTRRWPGVPARAFACLGHRNGKRGMAVIPELDLIVSWNDSRLDAMPETPHPVGELLRRLAAAAEPER